MTLDELAVALVRHVYHAPVPLHLCNTFPPPFLSLLVEGAQVGGNARCLVMNGTAESAMNIAYATNTRDKETKVRKKISGRQRQNQLILT